MSQRSLKETIDRMVEESIRRVLPGVMNEVLLRVVANSGAISEAKASRQKPTRKAPKKQRLIEQRKAAKKAKPQRAQSLDDILDPTAGSEFYADPREAMRESVSRDEVDVDVDDEQDGHGRLDGLAPHLRHLAEDVSMDFDDENEMWGDERSPVVSQLPAAGPPIDRAARALGLDFNRLKGTIAKTTPKVVRESVEDRQAKASWEARRIASNRLKLNGGKPVE